MKHILLLILLLIPIHFAIAKDGRDRALPDEYECPGCGGWERYRQDQAYERERHEKRDRQMLEWQQKQLLNEKRKQTELLEEQNEILRGIEMQQRLRGDGW